MSGKSLKKILSVFFSMIILFTAISSLFNVYAVDTVQVTIDIGGSGHVSVTYDGLTGKKDVFSSFQNKIERGKRLHLVADNEYVGDDTMFVCWIETKKSTQTKKILSYEKTLDITLIGDVSLRAEYTNLTDSKYVTKYVNNAGIIISHQEIETGSLAVPYAGPKLPGFNFVRWDKSPQEFKNCTDFVIVKPIYEPIPAEYQVQFTNQSGECSGNGTYSSFSVARVVAAAQNNLNESFSYWKDNSTGEKVSYYSNYAFYVYKDVTLTAVYGEEITGDKVSVRITHAIPDSANGKITFFAERSVAPEFEVEMHGILMTKAGYVFEDESAFIIESNPNVVVCGKGKTFERTGTYALSKKDVLSGDVWYARAYVVYRDSNGDLTTVYSEISQGYSF
ncbi:MAG TPA: hypothetical protein VFD52_07535 [Clostridia bacterium]|nr:hypothetical protein [Clostridia bacterium]